MFEEARFPVEERNVFVDGGLPVPEAQAIWRPDKNICLGIKTKKYRLVKHGDFLDIVAPVLESEYLNNSSLKICQNGAIMFCKFFSDTHYKEEIKVGDIVKFGIEVFNSYDGTSRCGALLVAERLVCSNGMVVPSTLLSFSIKHIGTVEMVKIKDEIKFILHNIGNCIVNYKKWSETEISIDRVELFFKKFFGNREKEQLFEGFKVAEKHNTVWDLYNYLTAWLSHKLKTRGKNKEQNLRLLQWKKEIPITTNFIKEF